MEAVKKKKCQFYPFGDLYTHLARPGLNMRSRFLVLGERLMFLEKLIFTSLNKKVISHPWRTDWTARSPAKCSEQIRGYQTQQRTCACAGSSSYHTLTPASTLCPSMKPQLKYHLLQEACLDCYK